MLCSGSVKYSMISRLSRVLHDYPALLTINTHESMQNPKMDKNKRDLIYIIKIFPVSIDSLDQTANEEMLKGNAIRLMVPVSFQHEWEEVLHL